MNLLTGLQNSRKIANLTLQEGASKISEIFKKAPI